MTSTTNNSETPKHPIADMFLEMVEKAIEDGTTDAFWSDKDNQRIAAEIRAFNKSHGVRKGGRFSQAFRDIQDNK